MKIPLMNLKAQFQPIREPLWDAIQRVVESQQFIFGPEVDGFEREIADYLGIPHAIGVSSGTDALLMALMALDIKEGDEVITTPFTFFATVEAIVRIGARPVFADIDPDTLLLDTECVSEVVSPRTGAIIPVHLYGQMANMDALKDIALPGDVPIIEDAAQAFGARNESGAFAGTLGSIGCFSFFPSKSLGGFGDGGLVTTHDTVVADWIRLIRNHGNRERFHHLAIGGNFRLDAIQAAVLRVKLPHVERWNERRREIALQYKEMLTQAGLVESGHVRLLTNGGGKDACHLFVCRFNDRDRLKAYLAEKGIDTAVYYPEPLHLQPCLAYLGYEEGDLPHAEQACTEVLALPLYAEMTEEQIAYVVEKIAAFYREEKGSAS